jgi:hypothetical protein
MIGKKKRYHEKMRALARKKDFLAFNKMPIHLGIIYITFCNIVVISEVIKSVLFKAC